MLRFAAGRLQNSIRTEKIFRIIVDFPGKVRIITYCMDIQEECTISQFGNLSLRPGDRIVVGAKQLRKALCSGRAVRVYLAEDADPAITQPLEELCRQHEVPCAWVAAMDGLGRACGIEVGAAAAAVVA